MHHVVCLFTLQLALVLINRPWRDGRLSWHWYTAAAGGSRTHDLAIASQALYHMATAYRTLNHINHTIISHMTAHTATQSTAYLLFFEYFHGVEALGGLVLWQHDSSKWACTQCPHSLELVQRRRVLTDRQNWYKLQRRKQSTTDVWCIRIALRFHAVTACQRRLRVFCQWPTKRCREKTFLSNESVSGLTAYQHN